MQKLGLKESDRPFLRNALNSLVQSGKIARKGKFFYCSPGSLESYSGEIVLDSEEQFQVRFFDENNSERLLRANTKKVSHISAGDKVEFSVTKGKKSDEEIARVKKVLNKEAFSVTGTVRKSGYEIYVVPDSKIIKKDIFISDSSGKAKDGDKVVCEILNAEELFPDGDIKTSLISEAEPEGKIIEILGKSGKVDVELESIIRKFNLTREFPNSAIIESEKINFIEDLEERIDLRNEVCFTIDPEDAKDFDDAVSIEKTEIGYKIGVHIADVSFYVKENTSLDIEALRRGTSVYLVNHVIPMLPERLSNELCSLKPGEDRLTFSVFMELDKKYELVKYEIAKTIINSKRRFTYQEAQNIIDTKKGDFKKELTLMHRISKTLTKMRMKEGSIDFESPEVKFEFDKTGKVKNIKIKERLDSMRLIEEFMLLANKCATIFVKELKKKNRFDYPFVYRVHDTPDADKLKDLAEFITQFGYNLNLNDKKSIKSLTDKIKGKPEEYIINNLLIRSMAKAIYTNKNIGHYGLGFGDYTHFTSPIRRYPDLIVHRILKDYLYPKDTQTARVNHYRQILKDVCKQCSAMEQNAVQAERETLKLKQIEYVRQHIGDEFDAIISGIVKYGMYVEIIDLLIEGMIRFRDIEDDYYEYDEKKHCAVGRRRRNVFRAGQKVKVSLMKAEIETRRIDFLLV